VKILEHLMEQTSGEVREASEVDGDVLAGVEELCSEGNLLDAKLRLHEVLEGDPGNPGACYLMGEILRRQGEVEMAAYFHERAMNGS
jgi:DEAD/DEAH box helicase domain-containing protein